MAYASKGRKPFERASKIAHAEIINNAAVTAYLKACDLPSAPPAADVRRYVHAIGPADTSAMQAVIAIDGGFTETYLREEYPSASIAFFTFGPLFFRLADLRRLDHQRFIAPEDLAALKTLQRYTLTLPIRGVRLAGDPSLVSTVRRTIYDFLIQQPAPNEVPLIRTLRWFLFRRWETPPDDAREARLEQCPYAACSAPGPVFRFTSPTTTRCPTCNQPLYLTDVLRLHERVDEEQGAGGILSYVITMLEQLVLVHVIRSIWELKPALLDEILFLKDGPLAFFGLVAPLYRPMRELTAFLLSRRQAGTGGTHVGGLYLAGLEKSGSFVDHAAQIEEHIPAGAVMIPDNEYIYRFIVPGDHGAQTFGSNTYYGQKVFFKSAVGDMHVVTIPTSAYLPNPTPGDFPNLEAILHLIAELRCSMYDNALIPIALANKLVSLSDFPSQRILTAFARQVIA